WAARRLHLPAPDLLGAHSQSGHLEPGVAAAAAAGWAGIRNQERQMAGTDITINGPEGSYGAYLAKPSAGSGPGIVVIQEIFGVNKVMRDIADSFAARGYFALAPDLFWRLEPGVQLTDKSEAEWKRAFDLMTRFDVDSGVKDIQASISHVRGLDGCTGKVGAVGYCLGGLLAYLTA